MNKTVVAYFSVTGVTARAARLVAGAAGAELYEIVPQVPYTTADLDYTNRNSRSSVEMQNLNCRPALEDKVPDFSGCDKVYLGFPIWWGREPSVVDTFIDEACLQGITVIPFCTSGGSGVETAAARIKELSSGKACVATGCRIPADAVAEDVTRLICK